MNGRLQALAQHASTYRKNFDLTSPVKGLMAMMEGTNVSPIMAQVWLMVTIDDGLKSRPVRTRRYL